MTTASTSYPLIGSQPVGNFWIVDTTQNHPLGTKLLVTDPFFGGQELIYLQMPASTALKVGACLAYDVAASFVSTAVANTANLGKSVAFLLNAVASSASAQFAWAVVGGQTVAFSDASVAANTAFGIVAAGQVGAVSAGKQILSARVTKPATTTVAKANTQTQNGSNVLRMSSTDGLFVGVALTGTGIAASTEITAIDPDNRTVTISENATATGSVTVTGTYNDGTNYWNVITCNAPHAQGQDAIE